MHEELLYQHILKYYLQKNYYSYPRGMKPLLYQNTLQYYLHKYLKLPPPGHEAPSFIKIPYSITYTNI